MKIYFTCSTAEFLKYKDDYFAIREHLVQAEHLLVRDSLPEIEDKLLRGNIDVKDIKEIYKSCINSIKESDIVIIEDTVSNFSTGHQITIALQYKKPTLVLWQGKKYRQFKQMFIHGIDSDLLEVKEYEKENVNEIIDIFLSKFENFAEKNRFHLVLNNVERLYLDWAQFVKGKSRSKVIRDALRDVINTDQEYERYLHHKK